MAAVPTAGTKRGELMGLPGSVPNLLKPPPGCRFATRCAHAVAACDLGTPDTHEISPGHRVACIMAATVEA